ncbi:MAG: hypothetical protein KME30_16995 [Iphinoe sp. HA4291-MV1]|jgi:hypothetical protein|nr:hypothetical protein [Iphinoe sp. HA4291-MV1]
MRLRDSYYSINNWIAQIDNATAILNPLGYGKGKFVIEGWNPLGEYCICNQFFEKQEMAQEWILSLDVKTETIVCDVISASVFVCFDGSYWWSTQGSEQDSLQPCYHQLKAVKNMKHAIKKVKNILEQKSQKQYFVK